MKLFKIAVPLCCVASVFFSQQIVAKETCQFLDGTNAFIVSNCGDLTRELGTEDEKKHDCNMAASNKTISRGAFQNVNRCAWSSNQCNQTKKIVKVHCKSTH